jgi:diacylglycerol kinase (ATP)
MRGGIASALRKMGKGLEVRVTEGPGHAELLAREAVREGFGTVVAAGGDGTLNEVLAGLGDATVRLGVLPLGTMNVFAREHGIPLDWEDALARILRRNPKQVDLGLANGRPFGQLAGVGFDAAVIAGVTRESKRIWGPAAYLLSALRELRNPQPQLWVQAEGLAASEAVWVLIGLGRLYGGSFPVFPRAREEDGLLDVLIIRELSLLRSVGWMLGMPFGLHTRMEGVEYVQTRHVRIEGEAAWELDGEWGGRCPVVFKVKPGGIRLLV